MIERTIQIDGKDVRLKSSGMLPRIYWAKFRRDLFKDFNNLKDDYGENTKDGEDEEDEEKNGMSSISVNNLQVFENIAYAMAWHADSSIPDIEEWLEQFNIFSIYEVMPVILTMWNANLKTSVVPKKKSRNRRRRKPAS